MITFVLWAAVIIGCILALLTGSQEAITVVIWVALAVACGTLVHLVDVVKKYRHKAYMSFDCLANLHAACATCDCRCHRA